MTAQFTRAPHQSRPLAPTGAPNAALLIDFDNVTMGVRSDLSKELKNLLNSDVIKGKVAVQRAYADWRRYPQYIVSLSEASVDLIFAPAYGSSKKNATDIRLAIDALELVFTRPEIGTFILLSGDSDFSSLVLKLKEYGKYVIGVGMRESRSDLLVQNCDEYYSYSGLTGLTRAGEDSTPPSEDPWKLVERAIKKMNDRNDVMRSDRLKQVMLELDPNFDEKQIGYKKFNKFISEAANRHRLRLRRMDNGQYEVAPYKGGGRGRGQRSGSSSGKSRGGSRRSSQQRSSQQRSSRGKGKTLDLSTGYDLLRRAVRELGGDDGEAVRDSEVKRRLLKLEPDWSEEDFGLSKFSHFLRQAHNEEVIDLRRAANGIYEVLLPDGTDDAADGSDAARGGDQPDSSSQRESRSGLRGRRSRRRGADPEDRPPVLTGQTVSLDGDDAGQSDGEQDAAGEQSADGAGKGFAAELGLPTSSGAVIRYMVNSYKGVGKKTAQALIDGLGAENVFWAVEHREDRVRDVLGGGKRVSALFEAWGADYGRRKSGDDGDSESTGKTGLDEGAGQPREIDAGKDQRRAGSAAAAGGRASHDAGADDADGDDAGTDRAESDDAETDAAKTDAADSTPKADAGDADEKRGRRPSRLGRRRGSKSKAPAGGG